MHKDELKGHLKKAQGEIQEELGEAFGSPEDEREGQARQVEGEFDKAKGRIKEGLHDLID